MHFDLRQVGQQIATFYFFYINVLLFQTSKILPRKSHKKLVNIAGMFCIKLFHGTHLWKSSIYNANGVHLWKSSIFNAKGAQLWKSSTYNLKGDPPLEIINLQCKRGPPLKIIKLQCKRGPPLEFIKSSTYLPKYISGCRS